MNTLNISIILIISIYIIINNNNQYIIKIFNNNLFKILILFSMIVISNKHPTLALLICISYIITIQNNIKELFNNCLCGPKITDCPTGYNLINIHGLNPICNKSNNID